MLVPLAGSKRVGPNELDRQEAHVGAGQFDNFASRAGGALGDFVHVPPTNPSVGERGMTSS